MRVYRPMRSKTGREAGAARPVLIVSMSSPDYSSARLRPRRAGLRFTRCAHLTNGPIQERSPSGSDTTFLLRPSDEVLYKKDGAKGLCNRAKFDGQPERGGADERGKTLLDFEA